MNKNEMESIVNKNSIQIGKNATNISHLLRVMYGVLVGVLIQVIKSFL